VDYRLLSVLALLCWGIWGFLCKVLSRDMSGGAIVFWTNIGGLLPLVLYIISQRSWAWDRHAPLTLVAGAAGMAATILFYLALKAGPASVVVPLSGMYILIPAVLGFILLREPVTVRHVAGLVCAGAAIFFLSR
jgi:transporter family protein